MLERAKKAMHIAIVTPFVDEPDRIDGGVAGVSKYLADELCKRQGVQLSIIAPKSGAGGSVCEQWSGFEVWKLPNQGPWRFLPGIAYDITTGKRQIRVLLEQIKPDIVHFQGCAFLAAGCRFPHVLTIHGIMEKDALWSGHGPSGWLRYLLLKLTEERGRSKAPNTVVISEYVRAFLPKEGRQRTWLVENPVADSYFDVQWNPDPGRVFCCSRVIPRKNILGLIEAFSRISSEFPNAQLRIAGSTQTAPDYAARCKNLIVRRGLSGRVHLLDSLSISQVQQELAKSCCLTIPSFQETAPLAIEEAMAVGVPVVGARLGGIPYLVADGQTGYLVDPHSVDDVAAGLRKVLGDHTQARTMSEQARRAASLRFRASVIAERTLGVYREVLASC